MTKPAMTRDEDAVSDFIWLVRDPQGRVIGAAPDRTQEKDGTTVGDGALRALDQAFGAHSTADVYRVLTRDAVNTYADHFEHHGYTLTRLCQGGGRMTARSNWCYMCGSVVYADDVHSCYDARAVREQQERERALTVAERAIVEAAERWADHYGRRRWRSWRLVQNELAAAVRGLRAERGQV